MVFPDQAFKASSMLTALQEERCTNTIFVPTTLQALLDYNSTSDHRFDSLRQVDLGGALVSLKHLKQCIYSLGTKKVGTSFGMTEGSPLRATPVSDPNELIRGGPVIAGKPLREARVRICAPGSSIPLPRANTASSIRVAPRLSNPISVKAMLSTFTRMKRKIHGFARETKQSCMMIVASVSWVDTKT